MTYLLKFLVVLAPALLISCTGNHLVTDKAYRNEIERSFAERQKLAANRNADLFSILDTGLEPDREEAFKFLIAYMPLNDLADYDGNFFLAHADRALRARKQVPWGKDIPEHIFMHYVLPYRINNENLDSFRIVCYDEIHERIKGMDLRSAALEINYWCHEKVTYQPADIRTSAPLSTMLSARGRCGEESTFTVAALRTAGIPARQVYTPRWAHSDDNHAWVEVFIDGEWYYMGACEPEQVLDRGWFTEPARRAMLVHTKSFGAPYGTENFITKHSNFSNVNNLSKYAVTKTIFVKVLDSKGMPAENAQVEYQLFNYAEFFPLAVVPADENGISRFETGLGDLLIWARMGDEFDYEKISVSDADTLVLRLSSKTSSEYTIDLDLNVPPAPDPLPGISADIAAANSERVKKGDAVRQAYMDSWMKPAQAVAMAVRLKTDTAATKQVIARSMGNYSEISNFLENTPENLRTDAIALLTILPDKDLRDTKTVVLSDHLNSTPRNPAIDGDAFLKYVLNPRVANEMIVPWRRYFRENLPAELTTALNIVDFVNSTVKLAPEENYYKTPVTPSGVHKLKVSDEASRAIYFVALCRSAGIPARLEPARNVPQYLDGNEWHDVYFKDQQSPGNARGFVKLKSLTLDPVPEYYLHFTLARLENGRYNTLDYDYNRKVTDFTEELELPVGKYMLVTGNRISDIKILSSIIFFELKENEHRMIEVKIRDEALENRIYGKIEMESLAGNIPGMSNVTNATDKGIIIVWIEPEQEPTKHVLNDLPLAASEINKWGGYLLFLADSDRKLKNMNISDYKGLPVNSVFSSDEGLKALTNSIKMNLPASYQLPFVVVADKEGNILFTSSGYRIGIGSQIIRYIR